MNQAAVVAKNATTAADGKIYQVEYYNLDAIISVGYRVNSKQGTQFRQWATARLKEYLVEGYTINPKRLAEKNLERNGMLTLADGRNLIDNDTIAALTLFIAVSKSEEMETVKNVVISMLNRKELP